MYILFTWLTLFPIFKCMYCGEVFQLFIIDFVVLFLVEQRPVEQTPVTVSFDENVILFICKMVV